MLDMSAVAQINGVVSSQRSADQGWVVQRLAAHACPKLAGLDCSLKISLISPLHARGYLDNVQNSGLMGVRWWGGKCPKGSGKCGLSGR